MIANEAILSPHSVVEALLYSLAILLAVYAVWERIPDDYPSGRRLALAAALLTLFATFFVSSLRVDALRSDLRDSLAHVDADLRLLKRNEALVSIDGWTTPAGRAVNLILDDFLRSAESLRGATAKADFGEGLGFNLLAKLIEAEAENPIKPDTLHVIAVSPNIEEFKAGSALRASPYELALATGVRKGAIVERAYVLDSDMWERVSELRERLERGNAWEIPGDLETVGLPDLARHHRQGLLLYLVDPRILSSNDKTKADVVVAWRGEMDMLLFGANRVEDGTLRLILGNKGDVGKWQGFALQLKTHAIVVRRYEDSPPKASLWEP